MGTENRPKPTDCVKGVGDFSNHLSVWSKLQPWGVTLSPIGYLPGKCCLAAGNDDSMGQTRSPQSYPGRLSAGKALTNIRR